MSQPTHIDQMGFIAANSPMSI